MFGAKPFISVSRVLSLISVTDKQTFITDIQKAFQEGYESVYGICDKTILPTTDIEESFHKNGAERYFAIKNNEIVFPI